jgi:hypothetical protein
MNPCNTVVQSQSTYYPNETNHFQPPEPWRGHLDTAPLLFISSNPSIGTGAGYPDMSWTEDALEDYFTKSFGGGTREWIRDGTRVLLSDGAYAKATAFWAAIKQRAIELFGRAVVPGMDYALTEVVHCKSRSEAGVAEAINECASRYLPRVLAASSARVIVVLGRPAGNALRSWLAKQSGMAVGIPATIIEQTLTTASPSRTFVFAPHPNARQRRKLSETLTADDLLRLRDLLHPTTR